MRRKYGAPTSAHTACAEVVHDETEYAPGKHVAHVPQAPAWDVWPVAML